MRMLSGTAAQPPIARLWYDFLVEGALDEGEDISVVDQTAVISLSCTLQYSRPLFALDNQQGEDNRVHGINDGIIDFQVRML